jgi:hypothetical protein
LTEAKKVFEIEIMVDVGGASMVDEEVLLHKKKMHS